MSAHAYMMSKRPEMFGAEKPVKKTKAKIHFSEFVRPDGYWPQPYSIEQAFQTYRWMIRTGKPYSAYGEYSVYDLLIGRGVRGSTDLHYEPIVSIDMLRAVFHRAILGRPNCLAAVNWRQEYDITFGGIRVLAFPHYAPFIGTPLLGKSLSEAQIQKLLGLYFGVKGKLSVQLNSCHKRAVNILRAVIRVNTHDFKFGFDLEYGYDGSSWWHHLAEGEQFIDTFGRALVELHRVSGQQLVNNLER